jgi:hypothetical protein
MLLNAKTVGIVGKTGKQMMDRGWANPNGQRAKEKVATALSDWGRYLIVDDPRTADLILVVFETQRNLNLIKRANLVAELKVYPGGAAPTDETPVLWSGEAAESFRKMPATQVAEKLRDHVLSLENPASRKVEATVAATVVTLTDGQTVEGRVQGRVLVRRTTSNGGVVFRILEGRDITSIDASGVHANGEAIVLVGMKGATQHEVMQGLIWWNEGRDLKKGGGLIREIGTAQVAGARVPNSSLTSDSGEFLGEYRINHQDHKIELLLAIRLKRSDGTTVTIPASEIIVARD